MAVSDAGDRNATQELRDRERHLRFALEASLAIVFEWDIQNDRVRRLISKAASLPETGDNLGSFEDVVRAVHPDDRVSFRSSINAAMKSADGRYHSVHRIVDPDGTVHWVEEFGGVEFGCNGRPDRLLGIAHDITERKTAEDALRASEERYRLRVAELQAIFDTAPIGLAISDARGHHIRGNRANEVLFGFKPGDELSNTVRKASGDRIFHAGRELAPSEFPMQRAARGERIVGQELEVIRKDGEVVTVLASANPLPGNSQHGAVGAFLDITSRKKAERALQAAHETFRHLVDRSPFGICVIDSDFRLVRVSDGAQKIFENVRPLLGRDFSEVLRIIWYEPFASEVTERFKHTLQTGERYRSASTIEQRADISAKEAYDWTIERITLPDDRPGVVCHFYDLSERQRHQEHVQLLMREISHRSKNMLALVKAIATLTASQSTQDFLQSFGERINSLAAAHDLLVEGQWKSVPLSDLVHTQVKHFSGANGGRVSVQGPPMSLKPGAAQIIGMALHELGTNAVKYGSLSLDSGRVVVSWNATPEDEFELNWMEHSGPSVTKPERSGFGTSVTSTMVELSLGGDVTIDYAPSGLRWRLRCDLSNVIENMPVAASKQVQSQSLAPAPELPRRVLVVEDEPMIAYEITANLKQAGFDVIGPVGTVGQALALAERSGCDAAVLDVTLGSETSEPIAKRLLALGVPFVTMSGYSKSQLPAVFVNAPLLQKPQGLVHIVQSLKTLAGVDR